MICIPLDLIRPVLLTPLIDQIFANRDSEEPFRPFTDRGFLLPCQPCGCEQCY